MRISDWSSDVCSSDLPLRKLVRDLQLLGREHHLKAAIGDDFVGNIGTINGPQLRPALDHWQQAQAVSGDIGKAARDDRGLPEPCEFIEQDQDWDIAGSVGQIARIEIHQLLQEEAVNRRDPVDIVGRVTEIEDWKSTRLNSSH